MNTGSSLTCITAYLKFVLPETRGKHILHMYQYRVTSQMQENMIMIILRICRLCATNIQLVGLGGLGVTFSPRDPRFAGSNPAEVDGFFQDVKILSTSPPGGTLSWGSRV